METKFKQSNFQEISGIFADLVTLKSQYHTVEGN